MESIDLERIIAQLAPAMSIVTLATMGYLSVRYMGTNRPKPWRSAAKRTADLVGQCTVWITFLGALVYAALVQVDRYGVAVVLGFVLAMPASVALGLLAGWIHSRWRSKEVI